MKTKCAILLFSLFFLQYGITCVFADEVNEYFGSGCYKDGVRSWYFRAYDSTPEATFDDSGKNLGANRYSAFGKRISAIGVTNNREAFQSQDFREKVDQYNQGVRTMIPDSGQWGQPEPLVINGLDPKRIGDPVQFNPYRYARNNPINLTDPTGLAVVPQGMNCSPGPIDHLEDGLSYVLDGAADSFSGAADLFRYTALYSGTAYPGMYDSLANAADNVGNAIRPDDTGIKLYACRQIGQIDTMGVVGLTMPIGGMVKGGASFLRYLVSPGNPLIRPNGATAEAIADAVVFLGEDFVPEAATHGMPWAKSLPYSNRMMGSVLANKAGNKAIVSVFSLGRVDAAQAIVMARDLANAYKAAFPYVDQVMVDVVLTEGGAREVFEQTFAFEQLGAKTVSE